MIAFQVALGDFPDPADPGTADWNPLYGDLNIEKIDILIDSAPGGATASLPNRRRGLPALGRLGLRHHHGRLVQGR